MEDHMENKGSMNWKRETGIVSGSAGCDQIMPLNLLELFLFEL